MSGTVESLPGAGERAFPRLGKYVLVREIGRGGMGLVYEAHDSELGRRVALKTLHPALEADPVQRPIDEHRFVREARATARLRHPNVVTVYDAGLLDGRRFIAMELLHGKPLHSWWQTPGLPLRRKLEILRDAALGLDHAHEQGILHRDLKPANVFVAEGDRAVVMDFGLSKCEGDAPGSTITARGLAMGTPAYMSPEQAQGSRSVDLRTDVYALGVILYETLTGQTPFQGETGIEILVKAAQQDVTPPSRAAAAPPPELDRALENICLKALAKRADDRYPTALAFARDLTAWIDGRPVKVVPPTRRRLFPDPPGRVPWRALLAGALGAALVLGLLQFVPWRKAAPSLLDSIDLARDGVSGEWTRSGDGLACGPSLARIELPGRPPDEYDLRVEFRRLEGTGDVALILSHLGRSFAWKLGDHYSRFSGPRDHPSLVRGHRFVVTGRSHEAVVRVRRDRIEAFFDGSPVAAWAVADARPEADDAFTLRDPARLGLASYKSPVLFRRVELTPVTP